MNETSPWAIEGDREFEISLRPKTLHEFIGKEELKENLRIFIKAAKKRGEALDHVLFYGPPGLGKTTLAWIIAQELGVGIKSTTGPTIERAGDLAAILTDLSERDVLFIDEIHRLPKTAEEILYQALEDFRIDIIIGKGPSARSIKLDLPSFTLVGATTRAGLLTPSLRDRFGVINRLGFYDEKDLYKIVKRSSNILNIEISEEGAEEIAKRSRGTPRIANRLLRRIRDYAEILGEGIITKDLAKDGLRRLGVDSIGLDEMDRRILQTIMDKFSGGPVGIKTLATAISEEKDTIEDVYEPYLIQIGFLDRTPRGRCITELAYKHFKGKKYSDYQQNHKTYFNHKVHKG